MSTVRRPPQSARAWWTLNLRRGGWRTLPLAITASLAFGLLGCASPLHSLKERSLSEVKGVQQVAGPSHPKAYTTWLKALDAERAGDFTQAEALLKRTLDYDPRSATALARLGRVAAQRRHIPEAISLTRKALELEPQHAGATLQLATLLQFNNQLPEAEEAYRKAIQLSPKEEEPYLELANLLRTQGKADAGAKLLDDYERSGGEPGIQMLMAMAALDREAGRSAEAEAELLEVLDRYPDFPQAQRALLDLYLSEGGLPAVAARLEKLFLAHPWQTWIRDSLVELYARMGDIDGILRQVTDASESDVELSDGLRLQAVEELASRRDFDKALKVLEPMLKSGKETENETALFYAGYLYAKQKQYDRALSLFGKIPKGSNLFTRALDQRARTLQSTGRTVDATTLLTDYLKEEPDADDMRFTLISIHRQAEQYGDALRVAEELLTRDPDDVDALVQRGWLLHEMGRTDEAVTFLKKELESQSGRVRLHEALAAILTDASRLPDAVEVLKEALELQPGSESLRFQLGTCYDQLKQTDDAIAQMFKILELNKNSAEAMNFIGYTWAELGIRLPEAETFIKRALELDPNNGYITDSLGWVYFKAGRFAEAVKVLERAVALTTNEPVIVEHLGDALLKVGDKTRALEILKRAEKEFGEEERPTPGALERVKKKVAELEQEIRR